MNAVKPRMRADAKRLFCKARNLDADWLLSLMWRGWSGKRCERDTEHHRNEEKEKVGGSE